MGNQLRCQPSTQNSLESQWERESLCELAKLPVPDFLHGTSLVAQISDPDAPGHVAYSYQGKAKTVRTDNHRFTLHRGGYIELYDHDSDQKETKNVADQNPALCEKLNALIVEKQALQDRVLR